MSKKREAVQNTGGTYPERMGPVVICDGAPEGAPPGGCHGLVD